MSDPGGSPPVRVGIIGLSASGGFGAGAHVPALLALDGYELRGCSASTSASTAAAAHRYGVPRAFDSAADLVVSDEIDLVVVAIKVPFHRELVMAALDAGKPVLCEWPLGNGSAESAELAAEADRRGVRGVVGLQARSAPAIRFLRDLVAEGYVGEPLSTTVIGSGVTYGATVPPRARYSLDAGNGASMLTIPMGHTVDALCMVLGEVARASATVATRRPVVREEGTDEPVPMSVSDQVAVTGELAGGAVFALHYRGGLSRGTNFHWEINGTEGDIVMTGQTGHVQLADLEIRAGRGDDKALARIDVPATYHLVPPVAESGARICNVANAYAQLLGDLRSGSSVTPTFRDAAERHAAVERLVEPPQR